MRAGTFSCTTHFSDNLTTYHFLSDFRIKSLQVSIPSEIPETMIYLNGITVSGFPSHFHHCSVSGSINIRSRMSREVHACMELCRTINRVNTCTITGCCLTKIFIRNRLYGRNTFQHLIMVLTHINHIIERFRLDIKPFGKHIQLLSRVHHQLGIRQIHQFFVTVRPAITSLTNSRRNRICL